MVRFGRQIQSHDLGILSVFFHMHEIFIAKDIRVIAGKSSVQQIEIIVIIERHDRTRVHQHVFRLMHLGFTVYHVRIFVDLLDQLGISRPVGSGFPGCACCP